MSIELFRAPRWRGARRLCGALYLSCVAVVATSAEAAPRIWTWHIPPPGSEVHPFMTPAVREYVNWPSPEVVADRVAQQVRQRRLTWAQTCVILQNYGMGGTGEHATAALGYHPLDALPFPVVNPDEPPHEDNRWRTTWMRHGIAETKAWMNGFMARYQAIQLADPSIPPPARFHFDTELETGPCCGRLGLLLFDSMRFESQQGGRRFDTEPVPGFEGRTLADLYAANPFPYDTTLPMFEEPNIDFMRWWIPLNYEAVDAAMKESTYDLIHAAWGSQTRCSNYYTSAKYDGAQGRTYRNAYTDRDFGSDWVWAGAGDMQSLPLYVVHPNHREAGETLWDATLRIHQLNLENSIHSFGGAHQDEMAPWVPMPGQSAIRDGATYVVKLDDFRRMQAMLRGLGVNECIVWGDAEHNTVAGWDQMSAMVRQVWEPEIRAMYRVNGAEPQGLHRDTGWVRRCDVSTMNVISSGGTANETSIEVEFDASSIASDCRLGLVTAAFCTPDDATARAEMWNWVLNRWDLMENAAGVPSAWTARRGPGAMDWRYLPSSGHVRAADSVVRVRLSHRSARTLAFTSYYNLVQLFGTADAVPGDVDGDERVTVADLGMLLGAWGAAVEPYTGGDVDGDGVVFLPDVAILLYNWGDRAEASCQ